MLAFAAEHRFVTAAQIAVAVQASAGAVDTRLRALSNAGYLTRGQQLYGRPSAHQITRAGLRAAGSDLPAPKRLDLATYDHEEGVAWLMLAAHRGRFGALAAIVSERRMRSQDGRRADGTARHGVRVGATGPGGRERLHYPDLVVVTASGHRVAFELELTGKGRARRETILAAYGADRTVDAVMYLVDRPAVGQAIERSAARLGISHLVRVHDVRLARSARASDRASTAQRRPARGDRPEAGAGPGARARPVTPAPRRRRPGDARRLRRETATVTPGAGNARRLRRYLSLALWAGVLMAPSVAVAAGLLAGATAAFAGPALWRALARGRARRLAGRAGQAGGEPLVLGTDAHRRPVTLTDSQLAAHTLIVGASGAGKSTTMLADPGGRDPPRPPGGRHRHEGLAGVRGAAGPRRPGRRAPAAGLDPGRPEPLEPAGARQRRPRSRTC